MIESTAARPLVSFLVTGYNQERFLRDAIEGAFAQTYHPLEIILSDDGSSDASFALMQEMCATYRGPHEVRLNRNEKNLGTFQHLVRIGGMARGGLVVFAAGDDVSLPERTEVLCRTWVETGASALCSRYHVIDEAGRIVRRNGLLPTRSDFTKFIGKERGGQIRILQGATSAYARGLLDIDTTGLPRAVAEDNILNFVIALRGGRIEHVSDPLVLFRQHDAAASHRRTRGVSLGYRERHSRESAGDNLGKMLVYRRILEMENTSLSIAGMRALVNHEARLRSTVDWPHLSLPERIRHLLRSVAARDPRAAVWMLLRLFGPIDNYQPGRLVFGLLAISSKLTGRAR